MSVDTDQDIIRFEQDCQNGLVTFHTKLNEKIQTYSQAGQDLFVIAMLQGKTQGSFLEIGAGHPTFQNNTYLLESNYAFSGISLDLGDSHDQTRVNQFTSFYNLIKGSEWPDIPGQFHNLPIWVQQECADHGCSWYCKEIWEILRRKSKYICTDALQFDYRILNRYFDYLQIDISPPWSNLMVMKKIIPEIRFAVITFEHDVWDQTDQSKVVRTESRKILQDHGYEMVVNDVTIRPGMGYGIGDNHIYFEDWYVDPTIVPRELIDKYQWIDYSDNPKYFDDILYNRFQ
jgi:hypothetical protein